MLVETVRKEMVDALKSGDKEAKNILSLLVAALDKAAKEKKSDLSDFEEGQVVLKMHKQIQETIETCPSDRVDILEKSKKELSVIDKHLPKQMSKEEIKSVIKSVITELNLETISSKDKGKIMKVLMPMVKGKADGKLVNNILLEYLNT